MLNPDQADTYNRTATFHPQMGKNTLPAIEIAGIQIYAGIDNTGYMHIAVDLDDTETTLTDNYGLVPIHVSITGTTIYNSDTDHINEIIWLTHILDGTDAGFDSDSNLNNLDYARTLVQTRLDRLRRL